MAKRSRRPGPPASGLLNWTGGGHWSEQARPCRYCGKPTHLRDSRGSPAHKVHAEEALARQQAEAAEAYGQGAL